jgi:hypothetical protein
MSKIQRDNSTEFQIGWEKRVVQADRNPGFDGVRVECQSPEHVALNDEYFADAEVALPILHQIATVDIQVGRIGFWLYSEHEDVMVAEIQQTFDGDLELVINDGSSYDDVKSGMMKNGLIRFDEEKGDFIVDARHYEELLTSDEYELLLEFVQRSLSEIRGGEEQLASSGIEIIMNSAIPRLQKLAKGYYHYVYSCKDGIPRFFPLPDLATTIPYNKSLRFREDIDGILTADLRPTIGYVADVSLQIRRNDSGGISRLELSSNFTTGSILCRGLDTDSPTFEYDRGGNSTGESIKISASSLEALYSLLHNFAWVAEEE